MTAAASNPPKKKKIKRRRISKHVVEAKKKAAAVNNDDKLPLPTTDQAEPETTSTQAAANESDHLNQAIAYLKAYIESKADNANESQKAAWKFNKNTQTWLIRHMYNAEVVSKSTFALLLEYFRGLQGNTKSRVLQEATDRVLQYKEFEKKQEAQNGNADESDQHKALRKEYKRARQIVQLLQ